MATIDQGIAFTNLQTELGRARARAEQAEAKLAALSLCEPGFLDRKLREIEVLRAAAKLAHHEMRHTIAPRNSFTDALDALDAVLYPRAHEQSERTEDR